MQRVIIHRLKRTEMNRNKSESEAVLPPKSNFSESRQRSAATCSPIFFAFESPTSPFQSLWPSEEEWRFPGIADRRKKMNLCEKRKKNGKRDLFAKFWRNSRPVTTAEENKKISPRPFVLPLFSLLSWWLTIGLNLQRKFGVTAYCGLNSKHWIGCKSDENYAATPILFLTIGSHVWDLKMIKFGLQGLKWFRYTIGCAIFFQ